MTPAQRSVTRLTSGQIAGRARSSLVVGRRRRATSPGTSSSARNRNPTWVTQRRRTCASSTARSAPRTMPAFRTGSSTCCRGCSPRSCPDPAATRRSACRGSRARNCRWASPRRSSAFRAWPTTAPSATRTRYRTARRTRTPIVHRRRPWPHDERRRLLPLPRRLREGSALQRRQPDERDQCSSRSLSWLDKALYRFLIIPITKKRLLEREAQFAWIYRTPTFPSGAAAATTR